MWHKKTIVKLMTKQKPKTWNQKLSWHPHLEKLFEDNKLQFLSVHAYSLSSRTEDCVISIKMDTTIRSVWNYVSYIHGEQDRTWEELSLESPNTSHWEQLMLLSRQQHELFSAPVLASPLHLSLLSDDCEIMTLWDYMTEMIALSQRE